MAKPLTPPLLIVGSSADPSDLRYGSGFTAVDPVVFVDAGRSKHLVVPLLECGRARRSCPSCRVWVPQELDVPPGKRRDAGAWACALMAKLGLRRARVAASLPASVWRDLEASGVRVVLSKDPVYPDRAVKTARETSCIAATQRAAVRAMQAAVRRIARCSISPSDWLVERGRRLSSEQVKEEIAIELLRRGCHARDTIVACGRQAADPHDRGHGPLRAGETIVIDIFPQHGETGYWGDITRTVVRGRARPEVRRMFRAVLRAHLCALGLVRSGRRGRDIHAAVQRVFEVAGFKTDFADGVARGFFHGTGHGVGLDIHEAPSISLADHVLRAGHVVTVEPGLYYPDLGGVRIEDTVVVTRTGHRLLAACPKSRLEI